MHNRLSKIKNTIMVIGATVLYGIIVLVTTKKMRQQMREEAVARVERRAQLKNSSQKKHGV